MSNNASNFHISFSEYRTYFDCPFKHFLGKLLEVEEPKGDPLIFGSVLHAALETVIKTKASKILYEPIFVKHLKEEISTTIAESNLGRSFTRQGLEIIKELNFFKRYENWEVVGVEEVLYEPLITTEEGHLIHFKGIIDLVLRNKEKRDQYLIIDWKSAYKQWNIEEKLKEENRRVFGQLALYKYFFSEKHKVPLENIETRFMVLPRFGEEIQPVKVEVTPEFMITTLDEVKQVAISIFHTDPLHLKKAKFDFTKRDLVCKNCFFGKNICNNEATQIVEKNNLKECVVE